METQIILNALYACLGGLFFLTLLVIAMTIIILRGRQEQADFIAWTVEKQIKKSFKKQKVPNLSARIKAILDNETTSDGESLDEVLELLKKEGIYERSQFD